MSERAPEQPDDEFPEPQAALSVIRALVDVWLEEMPPKQRRRVLDAVSKRLDWQASSAQIVRLRSPRWDMAARKAHAQGAAWFRQMRAVWFDRPR